MKRPVIIGNATLYLGRCEDVMPLLGDIDTVISDPPYNVGFEYDEYQDLRETDEWKAELARSLTMTKPKTIIYFPGVIGATKGLPINGEYRLVRWLGWHRREFAGDMWRGGPAISWEPIAWLSREHKPFYNKIFGHLGRDFIVVKDVKHEKARINHPCPKPLIVMDWLVRLFAGRGVVLDPYMGSGTTGVACARVGLSFIGIEMSPDYFEEACHRIKDAERQGRLFDPPRPRPVQEAML